MKLFSQFASVLVFVFGSVAVADSLSCHVGHMIVGGKPVELQKVKDGTFEARGKSMVYRARLMKFGDKKTSVTVDILEDGYPVSRGFGGSERMIASSETDVTKSKLEQEFSTTVNFTPEFSKDALAHTVACVYRP